MSSSQEEIEITEPVKKNHRSRHYSSPRFKTSKTELREQSSSVTRHRRASIQARIPKTRPSEKVATTTFVQTDESPVESTSMNNHTVQSAKADKHSSRTFGSGSRFADLKIITFQVLKNSWFIKSVGIAAAEAASVLLLIYSFVFLRNFVASGVAVSYFPWSWNVVYTDVGSVANLFSVGFVISLLVIIISTAILRYRLIPGYRKSLLRL